MNAIEEIKESLYESYKWLYEEALRGAKEELKLAKSLRGCEMRKMSASWLESAASSYRRAVRYKRSMNVYSN